MRNTYSEFHTYGVEWNEHGYTFYIDGKRTSHSHFGGASQVPEYMILSVEVSGENGIPQAGTFSTGSMKITDAISRQSLSLTM